jgi:ribonuclease HI
MSKLTCYIDGSEVETGENTIRQGWGILALHTVGQTNEIRGCIEHGLKEAKMRGFFELLAFYNTICYAEKLGLVPEEVSIYSDCDFITDSGFHLFKQNYSGQKIAIFKRLQLFQKMFYPTHKHVAMRMIRWLVGTQMHWTKAHNYDVNNCRVDYLARSAAKNKKAISFSTWLKFGFHKFDREKNAVTHFQMPFVK